MIRYALLPPLLFLGAAPPALAQELCVCLRCAIGTHRSFATISEDMRPTVPRGLCTVSERRLPGTDAPRPGDVILYIDPSDGQFALSRVIAEGGQTVAMVGGVLHLDGAPVETTPLSPHRIARRPDSTGALPTCPGGTPEDARFCDIPRMAETLPNGARYQTLNLIDGSALDDMAPVTVPEGYLFILGDHRDLARDSRTPVAEGGPGMIPLSAVQGLLEAPSPYMDPPS